jgi:hypothetical protein
MPLISDSEIRTPANPGGDTVLGPINQLPEPPKPSDVGFFDALAPAFRTENSVGAYLSREDDMPSRMNRIDPDFDPFSMIDGLEDYAPRFAFANTPEEVEAVRRQISRELADREMIDGAGLPGTAAAFAAAVIDPLNFIPVGGTAYRTYREGGSILKGALATARAGFLSTTAVEAALQANEETRTWGESALSIASGTFLSAVLGGAAYKLGELGGGRADRVFADLTTRVEKDLEVPAGDKPDPVMPGFHKVSEADLDADTGLPPRSLGAAAANERAPRALSLAAEAFEGLRTKLREFVSRAPNNASEKLELGPVGDDAVPRLNEILDQAGAPADVSGWRHTIDADAVRHILKQHGETARETGRGQLPLTAADFDRVPDVLADPDAILPSEGRTRRGLPVVVYRKAFDDGTVIYIEEVRTRRRELAAKSMWKEKVGNETSGGPNGPKARQSHVRNARPEDLARTVTPDGAAAQAAPEPMLDGQASPSAQPGPGPAGGSVGAAATRDTTLAEEGLKSALGLEKAIAFQDPLLRAATSPAITTRRVIQDLAESPLSYEKNRHGLPTAPGGSVETLIKMHSAPLAAALQSMDDAFTRYRLGRSKRFGDVARLGAADMMRGGRPEGRLTYTAFKAEVARAMRRGDQHEITEVGEAARAWREKVFDPLKDRAVELGLLPEDVEVKTAVSYLSRLYNVERIAARRPEFVGTVHSWLTERQEARRRLRGDLEGLLERQGTIEDVTARMEGRADTAARQGEVVGGRLDEARRQLERELTRAMDASDRETAAAARTGEANAALSQQVEAIRQRIVSSDFDLASPESLNGLFADITALADSDAIRQLVREIEGRGNQAAATDARLGDLRKRVSGQRVEISSSITALRERVNALHDRASGVRSKGDALTRYLEDLQARHKATKEDIQAIVDEWPGRADDARGILKTAVDHDDLELRDIAEQITDRILSTPDGRLPYDGQTVPEPRGGKSRPIVRGPLKARTFLIPDERIEPFLENDVEALGRIYTRTMAADTEIVARFGDVAMTDQLDNIRREYADMASRAATEAERTKIYKRRNADIRDIAAVRDRLRGTYALPRDPDSVISRAGKIAKSLNYLRLLGGMTTSALPDPFRIVMVHGLQRFAGDGLAPLVKNFSAFRMAADEVKLAGTALDMVLDTRTQAIADVLDDYGRHSRFERGLRSATNSFGIVSLMAPWNAAWKQVAGIVTMSRILEAGQAAASGKLAAKELERLAASGIDQEMAERIWRQFEAHGETNGDVKLANTLKWDDAAAVTSFRAAVVRDVDRIIVTPGQDKPLWLSTELGSVIGQFKTFQMASAQRVLLAGLQDRDAATLAGLTMMVGAGMGVYAFKSWEGGRPLSKDPTSWLIEGVDRSGVTGWFFEPNNIIEKATRGTIGLKPLLGGGQPMSRYASRNATDALLGPTFGLVEDALTVTGSAVSGDWKRSDTRAFRRILPYQSVTGFRNVVDLAEDGINQALGVPK